MLAKDKLVVVRVDLYMLMAMFEQPVLVDVGAAVAGSSVEVRDKPGEEALAAALNLLVIKETDGRASRQRNTRPLHEPPHGDKVIFGWCLFLIPEEGMKNRKITK